MSRFETSNYEKRDGIAYITLNQPESLNIYNIQMRDDLNEILRALKDDREVKVGVFSGAGEKAFCAGADLSEFLTAPPPVKARQVRFQRDIWGLFLRISQPMIAALHGYVLGSGIEIALCCDIRIAAEGTRFGLPEVGLGIIPAAGGTQTLPRLVGKGKAFEMLLTNQWVDAEEAHRIGMVNRVVSKAELLETAERIARKITTYDPMVVRYAKRAVIAGLNLTLQEGLDLEKRLAGGLMGSIRKGL